MTEKTITVADRQHDGVSPPLALSLIAMGVLIHLLWWIICEPPTLFSDFYKAYYPAAEHLWENGLRAPWPFTETGAGGFVNIPLIAWAFLPFVPLGEDYAGWVFLAIGALGVLAAWWCLVKLAGAKSNSSLAIALALLILVNGPLVNSLREGNTTHFILLALAFGLLMLREGRPLVAGAVIGATALIKLPMLLVLAYFLWRRRWHVIAGATASIGIVGGLSLLMFGIQAHFGWFQCCVEPFLTGVIPAFNVQSIDGFIIRLDTGASRLREWDPMTRTTVHQIARLAAFAVVFGTTFAVLRQPPRAAGSCMTSNGPGDVSRVELLDVAIMVVLAVVCSPVSWTHYYLLLLLPWSLLLGRILSGAADRRVSILTVTSMILASLPVLDVPDGPAMLREVLARTAISAWLFGGFLLLAALLIERRRAQHG
jgi:hypothetical protein